MSWPASLPTFVNGPLDATPLQQLADALRELGDDWTVDGRAASAIWTASSGSTGLVDGSYLSAYRAVGKTIDWKFKIVFGPSSFFAVGGQWILNPPVTAATTGVMYGGFAWDQSTANRYPIWFEMSSGTTMLGWAPPSTASGPLQALGSANPFTWADQDVMSVSLTYEAP